MAEQWTIDHLVPGGEGFARAADGRAAFAPETAPGDRIEVTEIEDKRGFVRAKAATLLEPGPGRVTPSCPSAARCGGCDWQHLSREAELQAKAGILREALARTGGVHQPPEPIAVHDVGSPLGYRQRLRLHLSDDGELGLYAKCSHDVVAIEGCQVSHPVISEAIPRVRAVVDRHRRAATALLAIELVASPKDGTLAVALVPRGPLSDDLAALRDDMEANFRVRIVGQPAARDGSDDLEYPLGEHVTLRAPVGAFTQVNWPVNQALVSAVVDGARARGARSFLDLYCGAGNFTLPLLAAGLTGRGVDSAGDGIEAARRAATRAGLDAGAFISGDVALELPRLSKSGERYDVVILDPPRGGAKRVLEPVAALGAPHLAMCACDPVTLARDIKTLLGKGYTLTEVSGYDMFPRTHHFETLAWLRRN